MADNNDDDNVEVYNYQGCKGERVPETVQKLIVEEGVQELPEKLCKEYRFLMELSLPIGLKKIGSWAFDGCERLVEINPIPTTVNYIGLRAFANCQLLKNVDFEDDQTSSHQQMTIANGAFSVLPIKRIKPPSSLCTLGSCAFRYCIALTEANLSETRVTIVPSGAFHECHFLQTVSLPNTVDHFGVEAFQDCVQLVTVIVPLDSSSQPITIGHCCFEGCKSLANLVLPEGSSCRGRNNFRGCTQIRERIHYERKRIVQGLIRRFARLGVHELCYDQGSTTPQMLEERIADPQNLLVDKFRMNPFHVFFSVPEPKMELLQVLLAHYPNHVLNWMDVNGKRPLDYLIKNWTDESASLLEATLESCMVEPLARWGTSSWIEMMRSKVQEIMDEDDAAHRIALLNETFLVFGHYETMGVSSVLELALWKAKLESESSSNDPQFETACIPHNPTDQNGTSDEGNNDPRPTPQKRRRLASPLDSRQASRFKCGSDVVVPNVMAFL